MTRVLFVDHTAQLGGAELCLLDTAKWLARGAEVVLFEDGPLRRRLEEAGVPVELLPAGPALLGIRRGTRRASPAAVVEVFRLGARLARRAAGFDVLYANSQKAFPVAALAGLLARRPVVWHLHDLLTAEHFAPGRIRGTVLLANTLADRVIANSRATAEAFIRSGGRRGLVEVVYNAIAPEAAPAGDGDVAVAPTAELPLAGGPVVGMFGRFHPWKGQHRIVEMLPFLPGVQVVLVGDALFGEQGYVQLVRARAGELGVSDRVHLLGFRDDVPRLMGAVDLVVHASDPPEPFGRVVVEAMLARRPVVAFASGGVPEIVEHGVTGLLCPPGDAAALRTAVARLLGDEALRRRMGEAGAERARRLFSPDAVYPQIERALEQAGGNRHGTG